MVGGDSTSGWTTGGGLEKTEVELTCGGEGGGGKRGGGKEEGGKGEGGKGGRGEVMRGWGERGDCIYLV